MAFFPFFFLLEKGARGAARVREEEVEGGRNNQVKRSVFAPHDTCVRVCVFLDNHSQRSMDYKKKTMTGYVLVTAAALASNHSSLARARPALASVKAPPCRTRSLPCFEAGSPRIGT